MTNIHDVRRSIAVLAETDDRSQVRFDPNLVREPDEDDRIAASIAADHWRD